MYSSVEMCGYCEDQIGAKDVLDDCLNKEIQLNSALFFAHPYRLDETEPLFDAAFDVSSALSHVTKQSSGQAQIGFGISEDLQI